MLEAPVPQLAAPRALIGREAEFDRISRLIDGALEHGGALLMIGDPGIGFGLAVIVPTEVADEIQAGGSGRCVAPMPARHAMVALSGDMVGQRAELEAVVLTA